MESLGAVVLIGFVVMASILWGIDAAVNNLRAAVLDLHKDLTKSLEQINDDLTEPL